VMYTLEVDGSEHAHSQAISRPVAWLGVRPTGPRDAASESERFARQERGPLGRAPPQANPKDSPVRRAPRLRSSAGRRRAGRRPAT
jgi:hypothetical protein